MARKTTPPPEPTVMLTAELGVNGIAEQLGEAPDDEVVALVIAIDEQRQDWVFTMRLAEYFAGEAAKFAKESSGREK